MSAAHILVVDDEADIRGLLKEILSEEGYDVDVAGDAGQARASRGLRCCTAYGAGGGPRHPCPRWGCCICCG